LVLSKKKAKRFTSRNGLTSDQLASMQNMVLRAYRLVPNEPMPMPKERGAEVAEDDVLACLPVGSSSKAAMAAMGSTKPQQPKAMFNVSQWTTQAQTTGSDS
jgi:hypothetical protein